MSNDNIVWQTKLHARLHDPAEKALVLLQDPAGHEHGTSRVLWRQSHGGEAPENSFLDNNNTNTLHAVAFSDGIKSATYTTVQRAEKWAAAADRPQWPTQQITVSTKQGKEQVLQVADWAQVNWPERPVLTHPLTGEHYDLGASGGLSDTDMDDIKQRSFQHFSTLLMRKNGITDFKKSALAFWRFGPDVQEPDNFSKIGALWNLLPGDTRTPDHSIWDHLDLTSAFAGAFAADPEGEAALLTLSIGPVQPFIAAARTTSDLWAGSHLLSRLAWEAMRPVCDQLGPDAILFPRLRGIPQVDLWLRDQVDLPPELFTDCDWSRSSTDANPLFSAALPNRFVAVVPASRAKEIAEQVESAVRQWLQALGEKVVLELLTAAGYAGGQESITTPYEQMKQQLQGFPEVHWAAVPFSLIRCRDKENQRDLDTSLLSDAMRPFFTGTGQPGFLASPAWQLLQKELQWHDSTAFFAPNPGVLYPAVFDLAERALAAAKSSRPFEQTLQQGWRCSLTGESEWLTTDREQLQWNQGYRQKQGTLWTALAKQKPSWAKQGEHLGALPAIKRLWPTLFQEEVGKALALTDDGSAKQIHRFVVSTHTMALAHQLAKVLGANISDALKITLKQQQRVALPRKLAKDINKIGQNADLIARIPGWLEYAQEANDDGTALDEAQRAIQQLLGTKEETYYGLLMMDGDRMGAILSGDEETGTAISYRDSFHPKVQKGFDDHAAGHPLIQQYGKQARPISPNRHQAISGALNDFSQIVVRHVVEEEHLGRLIYAGGDDVLAMLPVADLLSTMERLRYCYSGAAPNDEGADRGSLRRRNTLVCKGGFAWLNGRLMRMMGKNATASCGAIIAHHQAPLSAVLRELRSAESRAKNDGGRNAFSLTIIKRSGGSLYFTEKWGEPIALLAATRDFLCLEGVSRRAVYHTLEWLDEHQLPADAFECGMAQSLLSYQLDRQANGIGKQQVPELTIRMVKLALGWPQEKRIAKLRHFLSVAEFLARETRSGADE